MTLEDRVVALEQENRVLKGDLQEKLAAIRANLEAAPLPNSGERWSRRAWVLALLNLTLAATLFFNANYFTMGDRSLGLGAETMAWLRGLWIALSFVWLILQLYPLALMYETQEGALRRMAWRNAGRMLLSNPTLLVALTCTVLLVSLASALAPTLWLWLVIVMAVGISCIGVQRVLVSVTKHAKR